MVTPVRGFTLRRFESTPTLAIRTTVPVARLAATFPQIFHEVVTHAERVGARLAGPPSACTTTLHPTPSRSRPVSR